MFHSTQSSILTAIISHKRPYDLFDPRKRYSRGFSDSNETTVFLKFSYLQHVEIYIEVFRPKYQG